MIYTDNPINDFLAHDMEQQEQLERLPKCDQCGKPIQDEFLYEIGNEILCESCMNDMYRMPNNAI